MITNLTNFLQKPELPHRDMETLLSDVTFCHATLLLVGEIACCWKSYMVLNS